jgi:hypothetical protein
MSQPWDKEYRQPKRRRRGSYRNRIGRKLDQLVVGTVMVFCVYVLVAKHSVNARNE